MNPKARIAIPVPTGTDHEYNQRSWPQYAAAVEQAGGAAVEVSLALSPAEIARLITRCQGILLPGSPTDVNPQKYGQDAVEACAVSDPRRENVDELLIQDAYNLHKPILAVCFGLQILNVWRGGTLLQDLTVMPVNHAAGPSVAIAHSASVVTESMLGAMLATEEAPIIDGFRRLPVNSSHHQAVGIAGDGLRVVARCPHDGVIEAVEGVGNGEGDGTHWVLGVQWHPERSLAISAASRAIFQRFVDQSGEWTPRAVRTLVSEFAGSG